MLTIFAGSSAQAGAMAPSANEARSAVWFDISSKPLTDALIEYAIQAKVSVELPRDIAKFNSPTELKGRYTLEEGLSHLLAGTGYAYKFLDSKTIVIVGEKQDERVWNEIVVTATKLPTRLDRVSNSISVLSAREIFQGAPSDIQAAASQLAGVIVTNLGPGQDKILMRGISDGALTGNTQSTVGIYLDESRLTYNAPDPDLALVDVDRIEVLRGPQGTLYGAGSVGGIYRIVTHPPDLTTYSGGLSIGAAATMHGDPSEQISGTLDLPLVTQRLALRLVGYDERWGGYIDDNGGLSNVNGVVRRGGRATAVLAFNDSWKISAGLVAQDIDSKDSQYVFVLSGRLRRFIGLREPSNNDFFHGFAMIEGSLGWASLTSTTSFVRHEIDSRYDATALVRSTFADSSGLGAFDHVRATDLWTEEARLSSAPGSTVRWFSGLFASRGAERQNATLIDLPIAIDYRELREDRIFELAFFGELYAPVSAKVTLGAGLRWHMASVDTDSSVVEPISALGRRFEGNLTSKGLAPKLSANYQATGSLTLYAQASEGYRVGGFNTAGLVDEDFAARPSALQPSQRYGKDELWNFELGSKLSLLHGALALRSAAFWGVWNNVQSDRLLPSGMIYTANLGDARSTGFEIEGSYRRKSLSLRAHISLNDAELIHPNTTLPFQPPRQLPDVPHFSAGLAIDYTRSIGNSYWLEVGAEVEYVGSSTLGFGLASPPMGDYANARLHASIGRRPWDLTFFLENPADTRGNTFSYGNPFTIRIDPQLTPLRPRTLGFSLSLSF